MHALILGRQSDSSRIDEETYYTQLTRFFREAADAQATVNYTLFSKLLFEVADGRSRIYDEQNKSDLKAFDVVFIRGQFRKRLDVVYVVSHYMRAHGKLIVNDYSHSRTSSKLSQAFIFSELGIPTPHTLCGQAGVLKRHSGQLSMPFICKEVYGSHGSDNHLISSASQLNAVLDGDSAQLYALQEFVVNDGDYRVLYIGEKYLIIKRIAAAGSHLNNTSQGGRAELLEPDALPSQVIEQGRSLMKRMGMQIAGIDIIYDRARDRYLFLEVNAQPQLFTGAFTDTKQRLLADYFTSLSQARA